MTDFTDVTPVPRTVNSYPSLAGRTIVVTGGNSGIGAEICRAAGRQGANVVIDYIGSDEPNAALVAEIEQAGGRAIAVEADVTKLADLERLLAAAVDTYGQLDVWVNNAGIELRKHLLEATEENYDLVMGVNLKGAFFGTQLAARQFIAQREQGWTGSGVVINNSSVHEDWPMPGNAIYCCSKGGMRMLARNGGVELAEHGIRVVNVAPGAVVTPINRETLEAPELAEALHAAIPMQRVATADEIASLVMFLASDGASYITSTTVVADGGMMQFSPGL